MRENICLSLSFRLYILQGRAYLWLAETHELSRLGQIIVLEDTSWYYIMKAFLEKSFIFIHHYYQENLIILNFPEDIMEDYVDTALEYSLRAKFL